jgi:nicotinamide-nucleotide amidase
VSAVSAVSAVSTARVALVAVGDELLVGHIVNTNVAWLGRRLTDEGFTVVSQLTVGDDATATAAAIRAALAAADAVVVTGGLGPTPDDRTRPALAELTGTPLRRDDGLVEGLRAAYRRLGRRMPEANLVQADLPEGTEAIANPAGTAPGIRAETGGGVVYALPGVPHEMRAMVEQSVLPDLLRRAGPGQATVTRVLHTAGTWESAVADTLKEVDRELTGRGNPALAYLAGGGQVRLRITARAGSRAAAERLIAPVEARIRELLGADVYGADGDTLPGVVHARLLARGQTVAVAESLTGGLVAAMLTDTPGASATFRGGLVVYATDLKSALAGVPDPLLAAEGPVSPQVAAALAAGARDRLQATYGLGLTGVAGPDRQGDREPGTVYLALAGPGEADLRELNLPGDRDLVRQRAATAAVDLLRRHLTGG